MFLTKRFVFLIPSLLIVSIGNAQNTQPTIPPAPMATPGQCHALVNVPAKLSSKDIAVEMQSTGEDLEIIPAKYEWVEKKIPISDEIKTLEVIPATYKTIEEEILVEPEKKQYEVIPAEYAEVQEKIMTSPSMRSWKKSTNNSISLNGEVMRLIEAPAIYKTVTKKKMITPPQVREVVIPPVYTTIKKKVLDKPAATREVIIPAKYKTFRVKELTQTAKEIRKPTKAITKNIKQTVVTAPASLNWQRVPCDTDLKEENIIAIQEGLRRAGYDVSVDGKPGKGTLSALEQFQEANNLSKGAITIETMKALGVNID